MIKIIIWGTGIIANKYMKLYNNSMCEYAEIVAFIDNNETKQGELFWGYPVIFYENRNQYTFDYIVIMNNFGKAIWKQLGRDVENDKIVLSLNQFFELYMNNGYWKDKRILFYGDYMNYELVEYRARFTYAKVSYCEAEELNIREDFDFIYLCPPRLIAPIEKLLYEEKLRESIHNKTNIDDDCILNFDEWIQYLVYDRKIVGGNKNSDKSFFIIGPFDPMQGWGNILLRVLGGCSYAYSHGMTPIVDMQNVKNQYLPERLLGIHNVWEDFFEPISRYNLDEVYDSQHIILGGIDTHIDCQMDCKNIVYKENIVCLLKQTYENLFPRNEKVLGVIYRGTDYTVAYNHTSPWNLHAFISFVKNYLEEIGYNYIFLATEVEDAIVKFKEIFGEKVFWTEQKRFPASERRWLYSLHFDRENDEFEKGLEYITVLDMLSKCNSILGTNTGAFRASVVLNGNKYEHIKKLE